MPLPVSAGNNPVPSGPSQARGLIGMKVAAMQQQEAVSVSTSELCPVDPPSANSSASREAGQGAAARVTCIQVCNKQLWCSLLATVVVLPTSEL